MKKTLSRRSMLKQSLGWMAAPTLLGQALAAGMPDAAHWAVSTPHPEATAAAVPVLKMGGNAIDGAIAALAALCVVEPGNVGFAGYGGTMMIYLAKARRLVAIDFDSRAPFGFKPELFNEQVANHGYLAMGVPGVVAGMDLALRKYGTLPFKTVLAHSLELADQGFEVSDGLAKGFALLAKDADSTSVKALFPDGKLPSAGQRWASKDLARFIRTIGDGGAECFYRGDIGRRIVRQVRANGGILADEDFTRFKALEAEPISINYRGFDIFTPPVPSGGLTTLSILKTLENFDLASLPPWEAPYMHLFIQAAQLCWNERFQQFGDPEVVKFSTEELLSSSRAKERADMILRGQVVAGKATPPEGNHTVNVTVTDRDQNIASVTATQGSGFGSHVAVDGLGLVLGHGMSRFTYDPKSPNFPAPGKRMQHNMSPLVIMRDGRPWAGVGMPGGRMIVNVTAQLAIDIIDFGTSAQDAIAAPRVHVEGDEPMLLSAIAPESLQTDLETLGHRIKREKAIGGSPNIAIIDKATGRVDAASGKGSECVAVV